MNRSYEIVVADGSWQECLDVDFTPEEEAILNNPHSREDEVIAMLKEYAKRTRAPAGPDVCRQCDEVIARHLPEDSLVFSATVVLPSGHGIANFMYKGTSCQMRFE